VSSTPFFCFCFFCLDYAGSKLEEASRRFFGLDYAMTKAKYQQKLTMHLVKKEKEKPQCVGCRRKFKRSCIGCMLQEIPLMLEQGELEGLERSLEAERRRWLNVEGARGNRVDTTSFSIMDLALGSEKWMAAALATLKDGRQQ
jgi:hypothetical protein